MENLWVGNSHARGISAGEYELGMCDLLDLNVKLVDRI